MLRTDVASELRAGRDPLGEEFLTARPAASRRRRGAVYTPKSIVDAMIAWAKAHGTPDRVVDPGAGSGRFALAAAEAFPLAEVVAVEVDPDATAVLRANADAAELGHRVRAIEADYRSVRLPKIPGRTLFIGNPPYVRHHNIEPHWKSWYSRGAAAYGLPTSQLAGLHLHFFLKSRQLAAPGDYGIFITAAEWLEVNYGKTLRTLLLNGMGGLSVDMFQADNRVFGDAMTTAVVTCFEVGAEPRDLAIGVMPDLNGVIRFGAGRRVSAEVLSAEPRWTVFTRSAAARQDDLDAAECFRLGDLFRVKRGQVTGMNRVWIAGSQTPPLPRRFLVPTITKARELIASGGALTDPAGLRRVIDLPADLSHLAANEIEDIGRFLDWAKSLNADQSYIARHRAAWWAVGLYDPAPILVTYMGRRSPVFVRNQCGARHINIAHGLYPKRFLSPATLDRLVSWLNRNVGRELGRIYAGALVKFEPREVERIPIPQRQFIRTQ